MSTEAINKAIENRLEDKWSDASVSISWPNIDFETPEDGSSFIRLVIIHGASRQASLESTPLHRRLGTIIIQVFTQKGTGTKTAEQLADAAAAIFRSVTFSGITCKSPNFVTVGEIKDWFQMNVNVPFFADETF